MRDRMCLKEAFAKQKEIAQIQGVLKTMIDQTVEHVLKMEPETLRDTLAAAKRAQERLEDGGAQGLLDVLALLPFEAKQLFEFVGQLQEARESFFTNLPPHYLRRTPDEVQEAIRAVVSRDSLMPSEVESGWTPSCMDTFAAAFFKDYLALVFGVLAIAYALITAVKQTKQPYGRAAIEFLLLVIGFSLAIYVAAIDLALCESGSS